MRLPVHLQRAMATEAEAAREARAKVKSKYNRKLNSLIREGFKKKKKLMD